MSEVKAYWSREAVALILEVAEGTHIWATVLRPNESYAVIQHGRGYLAEDGLRLAPLRDAPDQTSLPIEPAELLSLWEAWNAELECWEDSHPPAYWESFQVTKLG